MNYEIGILCTECGDFVCYGTQVPGVELPKLKCDKCRREERLEHKIREAVRAEVQATLKDFFGPVRT